MEQIAKTVLLWIVAGSLAYLIDLNKADNKHNLPYWYCVIGGGIVLLITLLDLWPTEANSEEEDNMY
jgi:hypothetical protein